MKKQIEESLSCPECGRRQLKKLISAVAHHVSERDRLSEYDSDSPNNDAFYKDSRNIGLHAKKMAQKMGIDLGSDFEEKLEKVRTDPMCIVKDT
jgi:hypothetical protein